MTNEAYHAAEGISASGLKLIGRSPLHYWARYIDPNREPQQETPALRLGTAIHTAVLEPMRYSDEYVVAPQVDRRTKEGKATWAVFEAECQVAGKTVISQEDHATCMAISERLNRHPAASVLFRSGAPEVSMFWEDTETGMLCKCRPDWLIKGMAIIDVKSTQDASADAFSRSIYNYEYHMQSAWYLDGVRACLGKDAAEAFIFAAFEKDAPHAVAFYSADGEMVSLGRRLYRERLKTYAACKSNNFWPGYPAGITSISLPLWVLKAANDNQPGAAA